MDTNFTGEIESAGHPPVTARSCSAVARDGKLCLFDNDAEEFITIPWDDAEGGVAEMLEFEPIWGNPIMDFLRDLSEDEEETGDEDEEDDADADAEDDEEDDEEEDGNEDADDDAEPEEEPERELLGYRYRLEKDGAWGFISRCFSQSLSPRFSEFRRGEFFGRPQYTQLWSWSLREPEDGEERTYLELWYTEEYGTQHEEQSDLVMKSAFALAESWFDKVYGDEPKDEGTIGFPYDITLPYEDAVPGEEPFFCLLERNLVSWEGEDINWEGGHCSALIYAPNSEGECYVLGYTQKEEKRDFYFYEMRAENRIITKCDAFGFNRSEMPFFDWHTFWGFEANYRIEYRELDKLTWYESGELKYLGKDYYAICRDGYWALLDYRKHRSSPLTPFQRNTILTPYAFTRIETLTDQYGMVHEDYDDYFLIERFGQWGVLRVVFEDTVEYLVPCEYESVQLEVDDDALFDASLDLDGRFLVSRMGSAGEIGLDGGWLVRLHREEDE